MIRLAPRSTQSCASAASDVYKRQAYIRFAIVDKKVGKAVGTTEIFGGTLGGVPSGSGGFGVLRIDLALAYETAPLLDELVSLAADRWMPEFAIPLLYTCLLYTSDAADDLLCVDLGGRRILKKKK